MSQEIKDLIKIIELSNYSCIAGKLTFYRSWIKLKKLIIDGMIDNGIDKIIGQDEIKNPANRSISVSEIKKLNNENDTFSPEDNRSS